MGLSEPKIECPIYDSVTDMFERDFPSKKISERLRTCNATLNAKGIHTQFYTSEQNAADFASLREALGYEQVNLYGVSYGTLLGLLVLRDHPQGIRSVILDSVLPPNVNTNENATLPFENAFSRMIANCNADPICRLTYPNLKEDYEKAFERLRAEPARIDVDGKIVVYSEVNFRDTIYRGLATDTGNVPATIKEIANGNYDLLKPFFRRVFETELSSLPNNALYAAMMCPQMGVSTTAERISAEQEKHAEGFRNPSATSGIGGYRLCQAWGMDEMQPASLPSTAAIGRI
jgi:pimeloyl-ACP methyl ester carboxylesterase